MLFEPAHTIVSLSRTDICSRESWCWTLAVERAFCLLCALKLERAMLWLLTTLGSSRRQRRLQETMALPTLSRIPEPVLEVPPAC